jgi:CheY-like chemotaxis protein
VGDHRQIRQLIGNLVENAWESMERKKVGVVTVEASTRHCDTEYLDQFVLGRDLKPGPYIQISVSDHGCGMNAEVLERLYDPFYSTREVGRGLGLPAVLGIVRAHKGAIRVYSEPGEGTTVNVMFPAQANSSERGRLMDDPKRAEWNGKGTALLVDDDELVLKLGRRMLTQLGVETVVALSGDEAVRVLKANPDKFDCAIIDRTMPEMNGEILFDKIRSLAPSLPVIISSGHSEHDIRSRFARRRIAGFIQKPYQLAQLRVVLARVLGD